jgi:hypothetical protein
MRANGCYKTRSSRDAPFFTKHVAAIVRRPVGVRETEQLLRVFQKAKAGDYPSWGYFYQRMVWMAKELMSYCATEDQNGNAPSVRSQMDAVRYNAHHDTGPKSAIRWHTLAIEYRYPGWFVYDREIIVWNCYQRIRGRDCYQRE